MTAVPGPGRGDAPSAEPTSALAPRTPLPPEIVAEIRGVIAEARASAARDASHAPLRELAEALRANAEAMRLVQETQERIARAVDRSDRSEAVIQSTQALNETFRGVRRAQDALVTRLEREERRPLRAALLAGALVLVAGGAAALVFLLREDGLERRIADLRSELVAAAPAPGGDGGDSRERDLLDRLAALQARTSRSDADREAAERELAGIRSSMETLRREKDALAQREEEARRRGVDQSRLEEELARLRRESAAAAVRASAAEEALAVRDREVAALREAAAAPPAAAPPAAPPAVDGPPAATPAGAPTAGAPPDGATDRPDAGGGPAAGGAPVAPSTAVRDPAQVARFLDTLNGLLEGVGGRETYRVASADALDGRRLEGVVIEARRGDGLLLKRFRAKECRIVLLGEARSLEIRMKDGGVSYLGNAEVPFLDGRYTASLAVDPAALRTAAHPLVAEQ